MAKFKVGDRVRFTDACSRGWWFGPHTAHKEGVVQAEDPSGGQYDVKVKGGQGARLAYVNDEHIEPAGVKIEAGKFYKTRDGRKVGPMENWVQGQYREKVGDGRYWSEDGKGEGCASGADLVAEWRDEPSSEDNSANEPLFRKGDIVECLNDYEGQFTKGKRYVVAADYPAASPPWSSVAVEKDDRGSDSNGWSRDYFRRIHADKPARLDVSISGFGEWSVAPKVPTAIVALIENGQPKPSDRPHVHASRGAAEAEARRLARKHKGKTFGVYELVSERSVTAPAYKHEWQRLAACGHKVEAIKTLRAAADIGLSPAIDAVERFLQAA